MGRLGYVTALDGVRGMAILLVVACHYWRRPLDGGPVGVGLFFVLSGFLITTLLLEERAATGAVSLRRFYIRRAQRLLPALAALLVVYLSVRAAYGQDGLATAALAGLYVGNIVQAFSLHDIVTGSCLAHLWSLAQEEQFYLVWPVMLLLLLRSKRPAAWLAALTVGLMLYRAGLAFDGASTARLYYGPDTRADWLLAGGLLALWRRAGYTIREPLPLIAYAALFFGLFADPWARAWQVWQAPLLIAAATGFVAAASAETQMAALLAARPLVGLGQISYSLYLWHVPAYAALGYRHRGLALLVALGAAALSYRFIEQPFRHRRRRFEKAAAEPAVQAA